MSIKSMTNRELMAYVKLGLAGLIILMGAYGYSTFFSNGQFSFAILLVVFLFIAIELAILTMTTEKFSSAIKQDKKINVFLWIGIFFMWIISGVGIDQTIWHLVEHKYNGVHTAKASVEAELEREEFLKNKISTIYASKEQYARQLKRLQARKDKLKKEQTVQARKLRDIIYYDGRTCETSVDCTARKKVAESVIKVTVADLRENNLDIQAVKLKQMQADSDLLKVKNELEHIVQQRVDFNKRRKVELTNKKDEAIVHVTLMHMINSIFGLNITTPERAYVMLLSFVVYIIYIVFVAFIASNTPERKEQRAREEKALKKAKPQPTLIKYIIKLIVYLIKTRKRKVITNEIETIKEVEVVKEVEIEIYKEGKEIQEVYIEVPKIIDKEVIVERIVHVPMIEKEFITVHAGSNLESVNDLALNGKIPKDLQVQQKPMKESSDD